MTDRKIETQRAIITAAKRLFIARGYRGTTTQQIAGEARISEMTLFRYFPTKEELYRAVIRPLTAFLDNLRIEERKAPQDIVKELLQDRLQFLVQERDLVRLVLMESYLLANSYNPVTEVTAKIDKLFASLRLADRELLLRLVMGYILSYLFLPSGGEHYDTNLDKFLKRLNSSIKQKSGN